MTSRGRLGEGVHVDCTHMSGDTSRGAVRGLYREPGLLHWTSRVMYCAHPVSGAGNNSLMHCYNMKPVSTYLYMCIYITVIFLSFPLPRLRGCVCLWCICTVLSDVCLLYLCPHWLNNLFFLIDVFLADLHQKENHLHTQLVKVKSVLFPSFCEKLKSWWEFSLLYWDH